MHAYIIVDLGFGDAGKGLLTDFLVRQLDAGVVVRYNGGAQAGHNVVTLDGRHHTFSQFGSGSFLPRVKTYLSRYVVIHPQALLIEGDILIGKGVHNPFSRLRVSDQALVITPFHQAVNRIRELVRGTARHGSCGVGVGEAVEDALAHPENRVAAGDLHNPVLLRQKLLKIREIKRDEVIALCKESSTELSSLSREIEIFNSDDVIDAWLATTTRINELGLVVSDSLLNRWLNETKHAVFEGAQGVLLDEDVGFHPYTTWSRCTAENARSLIEEMVPDSRVLRIGIMRSYAVRHGPGPLPTETDELKPVVFEHNKHNEWQGDVRYGWFDAVLARYALNIIGEVDCLAVTHLDALRRLKTWKYCIGYRGYHDPFNTSVISERSNDMLTDFHLPSPLSLLERTQFTQAVTAVTPVLKNCDTYNETVIREIESLIGRKVGFISHGPNAEDVQILNSFPS